MGAYCRRLKGLAVEVRQRLYLLGFSKFLVKAQSALGGRIIHMEQVGIAVAGAVFNLRVRWDCHRITF